MSETPSPDPAAGGTWAERNYRSLQVAVIVMGVLIVIGFIAVFVTIAARMAGSGAPQDTQPSATVLPQDIAPLFGPETEVVSSSIDGSRLALVLKRPEGLSVVVVDLRSGDILNVIGAD